MKSRIQGFETTGKEKKLSKKPPSPRSALAQKMTIMKQAQKKERLMKKLGAAKTKGEKKARVMDN